MTPLPDLLYVALFAVVIPLVDYGVFWPAHRRLASADPAFARKWLWATAIANQWVLVAFGAALWIASGRSWSDFGFAAPDGWRLWTAIALCALLIAYHLRAMGALARSADARADLLKQVAPVAAVVPQTRTELYWFGGVSVTAGFCEEFLYRGYFIWALAPWLGWWGAATLSVALFALGHLYQGWNGVVRTGIAGAFFTLTVALFDSLWPAIALHALVDLGGGAMAWMVLRERSAADDALQAEPPASGDAHGS